MDLFDLYKKEDSDDQDFEFNFEEYEDLEQQDSGIAASLLIEERENSTITLDFTQPLNTISDKSVAVKRKSEAETLVVDKKKICTIDLDDYHTEIEDKVIDLEDGSPVIIQEITQLVSEIVQEVEQVESDNIYIELNTTTVCETSRKSLSLANPLSKLLKKICKEFNLKEKDLVIVYNDLKLYPSTVPESIGITNGDTIKIYELEIYQPLQSKSLHLFINHHTSNEVKKFKIEIKQCDILQVLIRGICAQLKIPESQLVLEKNGVKLFPSVTISALGLQNESKLDSFLKQDYENRVKAKSERFNVVLEEQELKNESSFVIKVQYVDGTQTINVFPSQNFGEISQIVAKKYGKPSIRLFMDGEQLERNETVEGLGLEAGDILEAKV